MWRKSFDIQIINPNISTDLRWNGVLNAARLLDGRVAIIPGSGADAHHDLYRARDDGLEGHAVRLGFVRLQAHKLRLRHLDPHRRSAAHQRLHK